MNNRNVEFFNLSFLDLLSGALASIIFLFIIVPKGEITLHNDPVTVIYDTIQNKFYGNLPDGFPVTDRGDTLLAIVGELQGVPIAMQEPEPQTTESRQPTREKSRKKQDTPRKKSQQQVAQTTVEPAKLKGSRPNVPCMLSIEIRWSNKKDNVDLYVCKDNACVFGGKRHRDFIGYWDSGKARSSLFGGDLRTNQEAVRQFDAIIPGTYDIYAQYKESASDKPNIPVHLQVYTKNEANQERGDDHYFKLNLNPTDRTRIARLIVGKDGEIEFQTFK